MFSATVSMRFLVCLSAVAIIATMVPVARSDARYCGITLANTMHFLCKGQYESYVKRSGAPSAIIETKDNTDLEAPGIYDDDHYQLPARFARSPSSRLPWYIENDIVNACCENACNVDRMMSYCKQN